jgi:hypothetical protein
VLDPKPAKRIVDVELMRRLHLEMIGEVCEVCGLRIGTILHHVKYRSRGGDDVRSNFLWVCSICDADHASLPSISRYDGRARPTPAGASRPAE